MKMLVCILIDSKRVYTFWREGWILWRVKGFYEKIFATFIKH